MTASRERSSPRVSIGLPVRNGAEYLEQAIDSLLGQTFEDFELIIGDNASTDATAEICRAAAHDPRVKYRRHEANLGAAPNYRYVFSVASGEYFRWAAHDDLWHPEHLARSVEVLDADPSAVLSFTGAVDIDEAGRIVKRWEPRPELESSDPCARFREASATGETFPIFGLIRADVLRRVGPQGAYATADRVLLAELALHGPFREVAGDLFLHREHSERSIHAIRNRTERMHWWDTSLTGFFYFPEWLYLRDSARAVRRAPLDREIRRQCWKEVARWARLRRKQLLLDLGGGARQTVRAAGGRVAARLRPARANIATSGASSRST